MLELKVAATHVWETVAVPSRSPVRFGMGGIWEILQQKRGLARSFSPNLHEACPEKRGIEKIIMTMRTTESLVTFRNAFSLSSIDGPQPPGTYRLVVDEEEIPGLSFVAFRRTATMLHLPAISVVAPTVEVVYVDLLELQAALESDARASVDNN